MTEQRIVEAVSIYASKLAELGYQPERNVEATSFARRMRHIAWMCVAVKAMVENDDQIEKAFRWLGFIQGALWSAELYSIEELRQHNKPDSDEEKLR